MQMVSGKALELYKLIVQNENTDISWDILEVYTNLNMIRVPCDRH